MLTRLKVSGFKNLDNVDVRFGPFTCVAGPNGVGKSNLFDAISFLAALADKTLVEAALSVRGGNASRGDIRTLFRRVGDNVAETMTFEAEFLIPAEGEDELGQKAKASMTFLEYALELRYRPDRSIKGMGSLELVSEEMKYVSRSRAKRRLGFPHEEAWLQSVVLGQRGSPYISTDSNGGAPLVSLHADNSGEKGGGRPRKLPASSLPRTMLSSVSNAEEHRTLVLARQEMAGWTQLQLEPTALRAPDDFTSARSIGANGSHLAATLYELAQTEERRKRGGARDLYSRVANGLAQLVEDVRDVSVDVDEKRQSLSIVMTDRRGTPHFAGALSDGTLRFLALTVIEADPKSKPLLCLEEPENGVHPERIGTAVELLRDLSVDADEPVDETNPLRQVIVNTHSPTAVGHMKRSELLWAQPSPGGGVSIRHLPGTWRAGAKESGGEPTITKGEIQAYLNPLEGQVDQESAEVFQLSLPFSS